MIKILQPRLFVTSIYDIDIPHLKHLGIRGIIMDLDNTLVGWNEPEASNELIAWLVGLRQNDLQTCIVSNNVGTRVAEFSKKVGIRSIGQAAKPRRKAFREAMRRMGTHGRQTAVIGDQVFTDILGGNRLNLFTILVHPINQKEFWTTRMVRRLEHVVVPRRASMPSKNYRPIDSN